MKTAGLFILIALVSSSCVDFYDETRLDPRDRMTGSYDVEEYSVTYGEDVFYRMSVYESSFDRNEVILDNFYGADIRIVAEVHDNHLDIPFQIVQGYEVEGSGTYFAGRLELMYTVRDAYRNSYTDHCETIAFKH